MAKTVNKSELTTLMATQFALTKKMAGEILDFLGDVVINNAKSGNKVKLGTLGTFVAKDRKARTGVNPQTKKKIKIPATTVLQFQPSKPTKVEIAGKKK